MSRPRARWNALRGSGGLIVALLAASLASSAAAQPAPAPVGRPEAAKIRVCFTPETSCVHVLLEQIAGAKREILVHAHNFTDRRIMRALVEAKARGVDVQVIMTKKHEDAQSKALKTMLEAGVPTFIDAAARVAHNKVMIFDRRAVTTGSYNFSYAADRANAENLLLIEDSPAIVDDYVANWRRRMSLSRPPRIGPPAANDNRAKDGDDDE